MEKPTVESTVLDALPDAVFVIHDGAIVDANAAAAAMLGEARAALVGRKLADVLAAGESARLAMLEERRAAGWALPATCRVRFVRHDHVEVMTDLRRGSMSDGRMVISARDITESTRAEGLMGRLASLGSDAAMLEGADAVLSVSAPVFLALGWTVAYTEVLGAESITHRVLAPADDPVGEYGRSLIGRRVPIANTPVLAEVLRKGAALFLDNLPAQIDSPVKSATALSESMRRAHVVRSAWCPIPGPEGATHVLGVTGRGLTEHDFVAVQLFAARIGAANRIAALRTELVRTERLAAVGEMAAVLAHEVRNPLGVMFNALSVLRRPGAEADKNRMLDILVDEADGLRSLVDDLLDFAAPSPPQFELVQLAPLIEDALESARHDPSFAANQPVIGVSIPETLPLVFVDPALVRRALVNLLLNAFQHVPPGGRVSVHADAIDRRVRIRLWNEGGPIPSAVIGRLFEPFFTTKPSGSGLGLAIVKRISASLGGSIEVESTSAGGVAFSLWLRTG